VFTSGARKPDRDLNATEQDFLRRFCDGARQIGVRGQGTKDWLESYGIQQVEVIGDAAIAFEPVSVPDMAGDFKVGVNPRHMSEGLRPEEHQSSNRRNVELFARLCDEIVRQYGATLYFFDFCRNRFDSDLTAIQNVLARMAERDAAEAAKVFSFEENKDPIVAFSRLGRMDFVLSQRMHPSLVAWVQGVPSIGIEYQFGKTYDAFSPLGLQSFVLEIGDMNVDQYMEKMALVLDQESVLVDRCRARVEDLRSRQHQSLQRFLSALLRK
jgi:polysaccharide pyruvyl transferase WcaK-like protein